MSNVNIIVIIEKVQKRQPSISNLKELAQFSWSNLNPRSFSIGKVWLGRWKMSGHGGAHDWYKFKNCLPSSELVDLFEMYGLTDKEAKKLRDHMIKQGFFKIKFDLKYYDVKGRPAKYLLVKNF